ncbi:unnamed protein product [Larinioides sclopetarius]|uniref:Uncharacterized protein n=1 Tax=Larinioides sclopetarius TaxID=280406 RepID=A0AAV1ZU32_9ARAC
MHIQPPVIATSTSMLDCGIRNSTCRLW